MPTSLLLTKQFVNKPCVTARALSGVTKWIPRCQTSLSWSRRSSWPVTVFIVLLLVLFLFFVSSGKWRDSWNKAQTDFSLSLFQKNTRQFGRRIYQYVTSHLVILSGHRTILAFIQKCEIYMKWGKTFKQSKALIYCLIGAFGTTCHSNYLFVLFCISNSSI